MAKANPSRKPGRPPKQLTTEQDAEIFRLRRAGGSYAAIGRQLKISTSSVETSLARTISQCINENTELRAQLDLERLDAMLLSLWENIKTGDTSAIDKALRIIDARAKMLDTYRLAITPPSGLCLTLDDNSLPLLGKPETVERKTNLLRALEIHFTISEACRIAAVSTATYYEWLENDPIFRDYAQTAQAAVVDRMESRLLEIGQKGNITALLAFLNAHHPHYGRIKYEILERMLLPWIDEVLKIVATHVPAAAVQSLRDELLRSAERAVRKSS